MSGTKRFQVFHGTLARIEKVNAQADTLKDARKVARELIAKGYEFFWIKDDTDGQRYGLRGVYRG